MAIWTSRYSNKELNSGKYYAVGISLGKPKFSLGYRLRNQCYALAPERWMWGKELQEFKAMYFRKLDKMGTARVAQIIRELQQQAELSGQELVLLCFEDVRDPEDWCHRTMLAEWLKENIGWEIKELHNPDMPKIKKKEESKKEDDSYKQMTLFDTQNAWVV